MTGIKPLAAATLMAAALLGCGGGGGDGGSGNVTPTPDPVANPTELLQGFWSGSVGNAPDGATRTSVVIMPDGTGWAVLESPTAATGLAKAAFTGTGTSANAASITASGRYYRSASSTSVNVTGSGNVATGTLTGNLAFAGNAAGASAINWTPVTGYRTAARVADAAATWTGRLGDSALTVTWTINSSGALSGASTTGCTYTGTVRPNPAGIAVFDVAATEDCAGSTRALAGIATQNAAKSALNVAYTSDGGNSGGLLALTRSP